MADDEFSFINRFFSNLNSEFENEARQMGLVLGVGDDAALLNLDGSYAITTDSLIEHVHFFPNFDPALLGARTLDVNFSDLYAMGAYPQFVTLAINLPERYMDFDSYWEDFSEAFAKRLLLHRCSLVGGNISRTNARSAPMSFTITAIGKRFDPKRTFLRSGAKPGDVIICTGLLACNSLYVRACYNNVIRNLDHHRSKEFEAEAFNYDPRIAKFVEMMLPYCKCAIDVSDGLLGDLSHILNQSQCAAYVNYEALPIHPMAVELAPACRVTEKALLRLALSKGGEYNLICTLPQDNYEKFQEDLRNCPEMAGFPITKIGEVVEPNDEQLDELNSNYLATCPGLITLVNNAGEPAKLKLGSGSFNHFLSSTTS